MGPKWSPVVLPRQYVFRAIVAETGTAEMEMEMETAAETAFAVNSHAPKSPMMTRTCSPHLVRVLAPVDGLIVGCAASRYGEVRFVIDFTS